ncbi:hypothetical protein [Hyphomonas sp.]|uniref:hypothetical protein n=1 Tax=Hyphomonas sp. TaxID=87 RepID=UPI0025BE7BAD|nr:hypothetical protein [Hyphomonas sp.]
MRNPLIALIPAALIAGAAYAQADQQTADPQPAEAAQAEADAQAEEEEEAPPPPEAVIVEAEGSWERSTTAGRDTVTYMSTEGEELFSATCMRADTETGDRILQIKAVSAEDTVGAIDMFTSAGNARLPATPGITPNTAEGMTDPLDRPAYVLASGAGEIKITSGERGIVFETDPMLKSLIRGCYPDFAAGAAAAPAAEEEAGEAPAEEAEPNS